jgi:hypothetical protein
MLRVYHNAKLLAIVQKYYKIIVAHARFCLVIFVCRNNAVTYRGSKMAQAKGKVAKTVVTGYNTTQGVVVHTSAPITGVPANTPVAGIPANTLVGIAGQLRANIAQQLTAPVAPTGARTIGMVAFVNGWPNGQPVPGMVPYAVNGQPYTGPLAHTNPIAKAYAAGKPQQTAVPAFKQQGVVVKHASGKQCPLQSSNPSNNVMGPLVHTYLAANGGQATLGAIANHLANNCGAANVPNVVPYLVQHAFNRMHWLVAV